MNKQFLPYVGITPDYLVAYSLPECSFSNTRNIAGLKQNKHNGFLSDRAVTRLKKAISWLFYLTDENFFIDYKKNKNTNFKLTFVTLTLPSVQVHSDNEIKEKLLNQFLIEAKKKWNVLNYVWRAEKQSNGNIHFHLIFDRFVFHQDLRKTWNRICEKLNYVSAYQKNQIYANRNAIVRSAFKNKVEFELAIKRRNKGNSDSWSNPNSTDIHSLKNIKDVRAYCSKYMSKNEGEATSDSRSAVVGRIWFVSSALSQIKKATTMRYDAIERELFHLRNLSDKKIKVLDHCTLFLYNTKELLENKCTALLEIFNDYVKRCKIALSGGVVELGQVVFSPMC